MKSFVIQSYHLKLVEKRLITHILIEFLFFIYI